VTYVVPADQPNTVHEITERLFPAYTMDGGSFHLAGCSLRDHLFLRLQIRAGGRSIEFYVDGQGKEADAKQVEELGMTRTVPLETTRELPEPELRRLIACGMGLVAARLAEDEEPVLVSAQVICCKYARGKIRFAAGEQSTDLEFSGWARLLKPPPCICPSTGRSTFRLATTDDGRIAAADAIEVCAETGRRVLPDDLLTCWVTGRRALSHLFATCPVAGQHVLKREMMECGTCGEQVSSAVLTRGDCAACRSTEPVSREDPRLACLLARHPGLEDWSAWRIAETESVYILQARRALLQRLLLVADKESLEVRRLATGSRLKSGWRSVAPADYAEMLGGRHEPGA
jgi:hypothetical protein